MSLLAILFMLPVFFKRRNKKTKLIMIVLGTILIGLVANALVCSVFSGVLNRYQGRVIWLIPFVACLLIVKLIDERISANN